MIFEEGRTRRSSRWGRQAGGCLHRHLHRTGRTAGRAVIARLRHRSFTRTLDCQASPLLWTVKLHPYSKLSSFTLILWTVKLHPYSKLSSFTLTLDCQAAPLF